MGSLLQLFIEAGTLMLAGMVFVFAFLGILVVFINFVLAPLAKKYPDPKPASRKPLKSNVKGSGVDAGTVAAIGAAVSQYRKQRQL